MVVVVLQIGKLSAEVQDILKHLICHRLYLLYLFLMFSSNCCDLAFHVVSNCVEFLMGCLERDYLDDVVDRGIIEFGFISAADRFDAVEIQFFLDAVTMVTVILVKSKVLSFQLLDF